LAVKYFKLLLVLSSPLLITMSAANDHMMGICQLSKLKGTGDHIPRGCSRH